MNDVAETLHQLVGAAAKRLLKLSAEQAARPVAPGKWSPKQFIGHLIDSASHNHQRFVRAQLQDDLLFPGYEQDAWVAVQRYQDAPWNDLVELWLGMNRQLARVIDAAPEDRRRRLCTAHNLHEIAWESPRQDDPVTLEFFMIDYTNHLRHHLRQINPELAAAPQQQRPDGRFKSI